MFSKSPECAILDGLNPHDPNTKEPMLLMRIKITSDSTCDLSPELLERYDIEVIPLYILKDDIAYKDGVEITPLDIIGHVDGGGALCTTSAVGPGDYGEVFSRLCPSYDAVIHFNLGSKFSSCYQNARSVAADYPNLYLVDSNNLSTGQGMQVVLAARLAQQGADVAEILTTVESMRSRSECSFLLNRLDYMRKGGRCSMVQALGANLLHIRPCIEVIDGAMQMVGKYRGSPEKCFAAYAKDRLDGRDLKKDFAFITYTYGTSESIVQAVREVVAQYGGFAEVFETHAGSTVTCHCGPNCLGVLFFRA